MLGAVTAYAVIAGGGLQLADIVIHALELPPWSLRVLIWVAAAGLPITFVISWFWDLTRHGFVRTVAAPNRAVQSAPVEPGRMAEASAALEAIEPGGVLAGRYRIERELGRGGMGRVLAAEDLRLGRRVAVKVVTGPHDPARVRRFEQEARTAGSLEHPNVVAVYDLGEQGGIPFLVTELLDGHTLRTVCESAPLPADQVQGIALQLARGLAAAHASGIIHRDLKPENLFLTRDGRLKILDFGMAKLIAPEESGPGLTLTGALFGSPGYLSPEQARGEKPGPASDVFSAGAVLYELLCGRRAFPGASLVEAGHAAIALTPPPLPPKVPQPFVDLVFRTLEKDPRKRFRDGGELSRALEAMGGAAAPVQAGRGRRVSSSVMLVIAALAIGAAIASAIRVHPHATSSAPPAQPIASSAPTAQPAASSTPPAQPAAPAAPGAKQAAPELPGSNIGGPFENRPFQPVPTPPTPPGSPQGPGHSFPRPPEMSDQQWNALQQLSRGAAIPEASAAMIRAAHSVEAAGQPEGAVRMLERYVARQPNDLAAQLELAALLRQQGRRAQADAAIHTLAKSLKGDAWMDALVRAWAGALSDDQALEAAQAGGDRDQRRARRAQAYYYLGLKHETDAPPDLRTAKRYYEKASKEDVPEAQLAKDRLARLEPSRRGR